MSADIAPGRVAVVTGGGRGIGFGIARRLARANHRVVICGRNSDRLAEATATLALEGLSAVAITADVANESDVLKLFETVDSTFGRIDVLVNNAAAFDGGPFETLTLAAWNRVLDATLTGTFLCSREAFRRMQEQGGGRILNIGSISAQRPREGSAPYSAAKFGVWGLTQAIALDGRPYGITCCCLHPGNVMVERRANSDKPSDDEPMMQIDTIAEAAYAMLSVPADVNFLEAIVLPTTQAYLGRG